MSIDDFSFSGEQCEITVVEKGTVGSPITNVQTISGRITNFDSTGFNRNVNMERTFGAYRNSYQGYNPATVTFSFIYDQDPDIISSGSQIPMLGFMGGSYASGMTGISAYTLNSGSTVPEQKIKLLFREYTGSFGASLTDSERALKVIFYNATGVSINNTVAADGVLEGDINFTVLPFDVSGSSNYVEFEKPAGQNTGNFDTAEGNYDSGMGY